MKHSIEKNREKYLKIAKLFDKDAESAEQLYDLICSFLKVINLFRTMKESGVEQKDFEEVLKSPVLDFLPFGTREELEEILWESYE